MLSRLLHDRWRTDRTLTALAPPERVFTGAAAAGAARPYVVFHQTQAAPHARTSSRTAIDRTTWRASVWADDLPTAEAIAAALVACFERRDFGGGAVRVLNVARGDETRTRAADGVWQLAVDLHITSLERRGVTNHG